MVDSTLKQPARLPWLDGLRAVLALWVVVEHSVLRSNVAGHLGQWPILAGFSEAVMQAHLAVTAFIVISGFSLMLTVVRNGDELRGGVRGFFWRRCRRIWPPYYATLAFGVAVGVCTHTLAPGELRLNLWPHILILQDWIGSPFGLVVPMWSVAVEEHIYLLFPVILLAWLRYGWVKTAVFVTVLSWLAAAIYGAATPALYYFGPFCFGAAAAWMWGHDRKPAPWMWRSALVALLLTFAVNLTGAARDWRAIPVDEAWGLAAAVVIWAVACDNLGAVSRALGARPWPAIGAWSYSLYLVHCPAITLGRYWFGHYIPERSCPAMLLCGLAFGAASVLFAWLWSLIFERPFLSGRRDPKFADGFGPTMQRLPLLRLSAIAVVYCLSVAAGNLYRFDSMVYLLVPFVAAGACFVAWRCGADGWTCTAVGASAATRAIPAVAPELGLPCLVSVAVLAAIVSVARRDWLPVVCALAVASNPACAVLPVLIAMSARRGGRVADSLHAAVEAAA